MENFKTSLNKIYLCFLCIFLYFTNNPAFTQGAASVEVDPVVLQTLNQSVPVIGRVVSLKEAKVPAAVMGRVEKVLVEEGDQVKKGQILASIDTERYKWLANIASANVNAAKAELKSAKAETKINLVELERMNSLKNSSAFNASKYDKLQNQNIALLAKEEIVEAKLNSAIQEENIAKQNLSRATVAAPFNGIIELKMVELGEAVGLGFPMFQLISDTSVEIQADVPSNRARILKENNEIQISTTDNIKFISKVRALGVRENSNTRTIKIHLSYENSETNRKLFVGENVNISVPLGPGQEALTVHKDAILKREGMSLVYVVKEDSAQIKPVKLGDGVGERFIVLSGIEAGDLVVTKGNERLRPGQKVNPIPLENKEG
ncbi:MAG: hypothetical protein CMP15_07680, partial [Rickettsiales bacterium]|nr:hypothetical protein [Rickettsiales bacterium]